MIAVRFSVLGPLTVVRDGRRVPVPGGKIRAVLATLLLRPNQVVTVDHFAERLWDQRVPRNPRRVLQTNVARLRQSLGLGKLILTEPGGYLARLRADQLDLLRFRHLVEQAGRATAEEEGRLLHEALRLWHGPVCADVESDTLHRIDVPPLAEQRLQVLERRIDADLRAGEHAALTAELRALTAEHPLRERFWAQLMTALYRGGRQAEALDAYRAIAGLLRDELGIDPNAELRRLHHAVLTQERLVLRAARPAPQPASRPTPRQLPADVTAFTGRARELAALDRMSDASAAMVTAITGMAGAGKTALAVHAAHRLAPHFPDGQLFVDLHGHTRGRAPADPADTLARVLGLLGVPGEAIPPQLADRAALYRSVLAGRKMLVVLDDAVGEEQVRPLLPGTGACRVLVTSRRRLLDLDGARTVPVDVLPEADAILLFTRAAGRERLASAPQEAPAEVVRRCGLLPLAIHLAAARLQAHPAWSAGHLLERLREPGRRLGELRAGRRSVAGALELSCRGLAPDGRRAYRLLSLHPGADIVPEAAAALLSTTVAGVSARLERLLELHLLQEPEPGRYRFHELVRAHAAELAAREESEDGRRAALTRLLDHYSRAASAAMDRLYPYEADTRPHPPAPPAAPPAAVPAPDPATAAAWLEDEAATLLALARHAAEHGFPEHVRHLAATLHRCLVTRGRYAEAETLQTRALAAARAAAGRTGEMEALLALGELHHRQNRTEPAVRDLCQALSIARELGHRTGELRGLTVLAQVHAVHGPHPRSSADFSLALCVARRIGHRTGELDALIGRGDVLRRSGRYDEAFDTLTEALGIARANGHRTGEVHGLLGLGHVHLACGEYGPATGCFTRALESARRTGHLPAELDGLTALGDLHRAQGRHRQAHDHYERALGLARRAGNRTWQFEAVQGMGRLWHERGQAGRAFESHRQALRLAADLGRPGDQARAHDGLAHALAALGRREQARHHWTQALSILAPLGTRQAEEAGVDVESILGHLGRVTAEGSLRRLCQPRPA